MKCMYFKMAIIVYVTHAEHVMRSACPLTTLRVDRRAVPVLQHADMWCFLTTLYHW